MYLTILGGREIQRQDGVNESKIVRTLQQYECECERCTRVTDGGVSRSIEFPAMQVTSLFGLVFFRRTMSTQHWSRFVMSQVYMSKVQSV